jgi:N-acetylglucosaminyldiphosphoundecaprenol N-acetyl-beta-D-mannosaminyltransferase
VSTQAPGPIDTRGPECRLFGMRLARTSAADLVDHIFAELDRGRGGWLVTANLDFLRRYHHDAAARALYDAADLRVADGMPLAWAAWLQGTPLPERVAGSSLVFSLVERAAAKRRTLYLLGGSESANLGAARIFEERYPGLRLAGRSTPMFSAPPTHDELARVQDELASLRPDLLFVALGSPKQEQIIAALRPRLPATWMVGVGISLSFVAGEIHRAPRWMQRTGLEWAHRLAQEPGRLARRYLLEDLPFALRLLPSALLARFGGGKKRT